MQLAEGAVTVAVQQAADALPTRLRAWAAVVIVVYDRGVGVSKLMPADKATVALLCKHLVEGFRV